VELISFEDEQEEDLIFPKENSQDVELRGESRVLISIFLR
jgi:hypothetical protein